MLKFINSFSKPGYDMNSKFIQKAIFAQIVLLITGISLLFAQGEIISVNPPSAFTGETINLIIQGSGTNFVQGKSYIQFASCDITKTDALVSNPELLMVQLSIPKDIQTDEYYFEIVTNGHKVPGKLKIVNPEEGVEVMITVFPVQSVYLSDYDFSNMRNLPLLFTITVFTAGKNNLKVVAELSHADYGTVASAIKILPENACEMYTFDNRMFDTYVISKASDEIVESTGGNGTLPSGLYIYTVFVYHEDFGDPIEVTSFFFIPEVTTGIDLIGPGTPLDNDPQLIYTGTPYFEWFGEHYEFDFALYEVLEDQQSPDDITTNLPVLEMERINTTNFLYPTYAEILSEGTRYAWQVKAYLQTSSGEQEITSDVYWFIYNKSNNIALNLDRIEMSPDDIDLTPGDSVQVNVTGYKINGETIDVECDLNVIPSNGGRMNKGLWFIAGKKETTVAVIANCEGKENYITINIRQKK